MVVSPAEPHSLSPELQAQQTLAPTRSWGTGQLGLGVLSETLKSFCLEPEARLGPAGPAQLPEEPPLLEETDWSHSQLLDLGPIHALNFFCQQLRAQQRSSLQEEAAHPYPPVPDTVAPVPDMVVPPPREHWYHPILRLQEAKAQRSARPGAFPALCAPHPGWPHPDAEAAAATCGASAFPPGLAHAPTPAAPAAPAARLAALLSARGRGP